METTSYNLQNERSSISRLYFFYGNDYTYWKARMIIYLKFIDYDLWLSIENEPHRPFKVEDDIEIPKVISEYNNNDKKKLCSLYTSDPLIQTLKTS
jgi:hypothetical protein